MVQTVSTARGLVVIGGGTGAPNLAKALATREREGPVAVVCPVTDSGRSTGVARRLFGIPAPGDIRHALSILAASEEWASILERRIETGSESELKGMAVGNLVLGTMTVAMGDIGKATAHLGKLLNVRAEVLPVSVENLQLQATLADGRVVEGELEVRRPDKSPIETIRVLGATHGIWERTNQAIRAARCIVLGPGSLWTSIGAVLGVPGVREAISASGAQVILVANTTTQPGQTDGYDFNRHVAVLADLLGRMVDIVIANIERPPEDVGSALQDAGLNLLAPAPADGARLSSQGGTLMTDNLLGRRTLSTSLWQKLPTAYHDVERLAALIERVVDDA